MDMLGSFIISENTSDSLHCQCFGMEIQVGICVKSKILQQWTFHIVAIHRLSYFMRKVSQYLETLGWTHTIISRRPTLAWNLNLARNQYVSESESKLEESHSSASPSPSSDALSSASSSSDVSSSFTLAKISCRHDGKTGPSDHTGSM